MSIPEKGLSKEEILMTLQSYKQNDMSWKDGRVLAYVYDPGKEVMDITQQAYMMYLTENGLDPSTFPSLLRLEIEVVRMVADLLRGDQNVVGNVTSGGTESIMMAVKSIRDKARKEKPHITHPEMILPRTAHASFHKAAHYFGVKPVIVPFDPVTYHADVAAMRYAITDNTILLVASAPCYSQGVVDPIPEIGQLALERGIPFHVDACVGGIHLSFMRQMGLEVPPYDFSVDGVTSISADMHKYGYAAKGCSTILYRDRSYRLYQLFACSETTGYSLINTTMLSTKSGGPLAGAWAILNFLGKEGYLNIVREVQSATNRLIEGINATGDLRVLGKPDMCMLSFTSNTINLLNLADEMRLRGWYLQGQFSTELSPLNLHISVNYGTTPHVEKFLQDLLDSIETIRSAPPLDITGLKIFLEQILQNPTSDSIAQILAMGGIQGTALPERMAPINAVMEALPDHLADRLLIEYFNVLYA